MMFNDHKGKMPLNGEGALNSDNKGGYFFGVFIKHNHGSDESSRLPSSTCSGYGRLKLPMAADEIFITIDEGSAHSRLWIQHKG